MCACVCVCYDLIMPAILIRIRLDRTRFRFRSGFIGSISNEFDDRSFSREGKIAVVRIVVKIKQLN